MASRQITRLSSRSVFFADTFERLARRRPRPGRLAAAGTGRVISWRRGAVQAVGAGRGTAPSSSTSTSTARRSGRWPTRRWSATPRARRPGAAQRRRAGDGPRHRRLRAGRRAARPAAARPHRPRATWSRPATRPLQAVVLGRRRAGLPAPRGARRRRPPLAGMPVVIADLHSALPAVLAGLRADRPGRPGRLRDDRRRRAAAVVLPRPSPRSRPHLAGTVTAGQAFGGDLEASTVHTGLLAARHVLGADVTVVARAPATSAPAPRWGFSGRGRRRGGQRRRRARRPAGRVAADLATPTRAQRHRGVSHHSLTAYGRVALAPRGPRGARRPGARRSARRRCRELARHRLVEVASPGCSRRCGTARCRCRRWAAASTEDPRLPGRRRRRPARRRAAGLREPPPRHMCPIGERGPCFGTCARCRPRHMCPIGKRGPCFGTCARCRRGTCARSGSGVRASAHVRGAGAAHVPDPGAGSPPSAHVPGLADRPATGQPRGSPAGPTCLAPGSVEALN